MAGVRPSDERMKLPSAGQMLVIIAAFGAAWIIWTEARDRYWIPPWLGGPAANPADKNRQAPYKPAKPVSIPPLIEQLSQEYDPAARREALLKLSSVGPAAAEALDAIRTRLKDEEEGVRYAALLAISRISQDPEVFLSDLRAMVDDPNDGVRGLTLDLMANIGRPATGLALELVEHESPGMRSRILVVLRRIVCPETFPEISAAIEKLSLDADADVRCEALVALADWGMIDRDGIRMLLLSDHLVPGVRSKADPARNSRAVGCGAMVRLGADAADLVPDLIGLLEDYPEWEITVTGNDHGREVQDRRFAPGVWSILQTLSGLKQVARPAVPHLLGRVEKLDRGNRRLLAGILFEIGAEPEMVKTSLTGADGDWVKRSGLPVGRMLFWLDPEEARRQATELIRKFSDPNRVFSFDELSELGSLGGLGREAEPALPLLISMLAEKGPAADFWATQVLSRLGPTAAPAVPALIAKLEQARRRGDFVQGRHQSKFEALRNIGPAAESAVPVLLAILNSPEPAVVSGSHATGQQYAMWALGKMAKNSHNIELAIGRRLSSTSRFDRALAMHVLAQIDPDSPELIGELVEIIQHEKADYVCAHAALAIAGMSCDRGPAIAPLTKALADPSLIVRKGAAIALGSIGTAANSSLPALHQALLEARCGIPSLSPPEHNDRLPLPAGEIPQLPLVQALLEAIRDIERTD